MGRTCNTKGGEEEHVRPDREADHSPPTSTEVKKTWVLNSLPHTSSWHSP
jgi:hypothetical protein